MYNQKFRIIKDTGLNKVIIMLLSVLWLVSCVPEREGEVVTVKGNVFSEDLGITLIHEHVLVDWIGADSTGYHRWNRDEVLERVLPYFHEMAGRGVDTIGEFTPAYLGRDPFLLAELTRLTGIQIITNTGYYGAVGNRFIPAYVFDQSAEEIAAGWIDEFENGIEGSEIRPGFLKISVAEENPLSDFHQTLLQAAAITHLQTGMPIFSHTIGDIPAYEQVALLKENGVSPEAWVWTHAQTGSLEAVKELAEMGAWISLDNVRFEPNQEPKETGSLEWYAERLNELKNAGLLDKVLISHDAGWYDAGEPNGGDFRGYTDIFDFMLSRLVDTGFTDEEILKLLVDNPARALSLGVKPLQ